MTFRAVGAAIFISLLVPSVSLPGQRPGTNYDEARVPEYVLPDPLVRSNGDRVENADTWYRQRRGEILSLFETQVYGKSPEPREEMTFAVTSVDEQALSGKATRKEVTVYFNGQTDGPSMDILLYVPNGVEEPVPTLLGLNFFGNHSIHADPGIAMS